MEEGFWPKPLAAAFELAAAREYLRKHRDQIASELNPSSAETNSIDNVLQAVGAVFDNALDQWFRDLAEKGGADELDEEGGKDA